MSATKKDLLKAIELELAGLHRAEATSTSPSVPKARIDSFSTPLGSDPAKAGKWDAAHELVQQYEGDATASWIHAVLHKIEGDLGNARYWYHRANRMEHVEDEPRAELAAIQTELRQ